MTLSPGDRERLHLHEYPPGVSEDLHDAAVSAVVKAAAAMDARGLPGEIFSIRAIVGIVLEEVQRHALTEREHEAIRRLGDAASAFIPGIPMLHPVGEHDRNEFALRIHSAQHQVMAQAAGRIYPTLYRVAGRGLT